MEEKPEEGRLTRDGEWWWDGEQWQSVDRSAESGLLPATPAPPPAGRSRPLRWLALGVALLTLAALAAGIRLLVPSLTGQHAGDRPRPTAPATATPAPPPLGQRALARQYAQLVTSDGTQLDGDFQSVSAACGDPNGLAGCRSALVSLQDQVHRFQRDLDRETVPVCLRGADGALRASLDLFDRGTADAIAGIDQDQPDEVTAGTQFIQQGSRQLDQVRADLRATGC